MIEIKHLRLLRAIAQHGTLSGAARELGYSQPAVTQQVQGLERHLRTPLLIRTRNGIQLSDAGSILLRHSETVLSSMSQAESEVAAVAGLRAGRVRVTSFPSAAAALLPQTFAALNADHPGLQFSLVEANPPRALEMLRNGECDLAVVYAYSTAGEACEELVLGDGEVPTLLLEEQIHVALPVNHPSAAKRWVDLSDLRDATWIAGCPSCRGNLLHACGIAGFVPNIGFETDDYLALQRFAALGLGIALVPELMHSMARTETALAFRPVKPLTLRQITAVSTEPLLRLPAIRATLDELVRSSADPQLRLTG